MVHWLKTQRHVRIVNHSHNNAITCGLVGDKGVPLYQCSSGNCPSCPKYHPHVLESTPRSNFTLIHFITNEKHTKYKIHGILAQNTKTCQHCESQSQECD